MNWRKNLLIWLAGFWVVGTLWLLAWDSSSRHYVHFHSVKELRNYIKWKPNRVPFIAAHRGGPMPGYPENCIPTFANALRYAPCLLEIDIRKTQDGKMVLLHDSTLDRTTTGHGVLRRFPWRVVRSFHLKDPLGKVTEDTIPTLAQVFRWARGKAILELDVKKGVTATEILKFVQQWQARPFVVIITYTPQQALRYYRLDPQIMLSVSIRSTAALQRYLEMGIPPQNMIAFVGVRQPRPSLYAALHRLGIRAILGTMGNLDRKARKKGPSFFVQLWHKGADVLATDEVVLAARALQLWKAEKPTPVPVPE